MIKLLHLQSLIANTWFQAIAQVPCTSVLDTKSPQTDVHLSGETMTPPDLVQTPIQSHPKSVMNV